MTLTTNIKGYINGNEWGVIESQSPSIDSKVIIETDTNKIQDFCEGFGGVNFIYTITISSIINNNMEDVQNIVNYNIGYNEEGGAIDINGSKIETGRDSNVSLPCMVYGKITDISEINTLYCYILSEQDGIIEQEIGFDSSTNEFQFIRDTVPAGHSMIIFTTDALQ